MKKLIVLVVAICMVAMVLAGCGSTPTESPAASIEPEASTEPEPVASTEPEESTEPVASEDPEGGSAEVPDVIKIGWAPPAVTGVFKTATDYMELAAEDAKSAGFNIEIITKTGTDETNTAEQVKNIENLIQSGCDVIIISPSNADAVIAPINQAKEAGIYTIIVNLLEEIEGANVDAYIGFDNKVAGNISGYAVLDGLGGPGVLGEGEAVTVEDGTYLDQKWWQELYANADTSVPKGKVAIIEGIAGSIYSNLRVEGFREAIQTCPNVEEVQMLAADWDRQKAVKAAENILSANPELDAIWGASAEMAIGASIAVKNAGRENEVQVFSNDGTPESVEMLRNGEMVAETWHGFPEWGWYGVETGVKMVMGQTVDKLIDCYPRTEYKGNADDFYPNPALKPIDWEAIKAGA